MQIKKMATHREALRSVDRFNENDLSCFVGHDEFPRHVAA
jgi:hypothetical protein